MQLHKILNALIVVKDSSDGISAIGTIVDVLGRLTRVDVTRTFPTTIPIYGLYAVNTTRTADCSIYFNSDSGHTIRLNMYYMYWGYIDGGSGYTGMSNSWRSMGENRYITFFDDSRSNPYVDKYVNFNRIAGNSPQNYKTGYVFAIVDNRDIE